MPQRGRSFSKRRRSAGPAVLLVVGVLAVLPLSATPAIAVPWPSEWKPVGLQGLTIRAISATPHILCAGTEGQGVFCLDLGRAGSATAWESLGPAGVTVTWLWVDPVRPLHRFAAAGATWPSPSLYRTLDGGASWAAIDQFPSPGGWAGPAWAVHGVPDDGPLWAAGGSLWVSGDLGESWTVGGPYAGLDCLEIAPADPLEVWSGGETVIFMGFTVRTLDGGQTWESVWDSSGIGDNQTADVAAHPSLDGLVLSGHEGFVQRSEDHGGVWRRVLTAPARFFLAWDGASPDMAWAAGSPNGGTAHAFASRDRGLTWHDVTGATLAPHTVFRLAADAGRNGVVYAATDYGVFRYYGGGLPVCLDTRAGIESLLLSPGLCPAAAEGAAPGEANAGDGATGPAIAGDAIVFDIGQVSATGTHVDLGLVECLIAGGDLAFTTLDTPDPAPGRALGILVRAAGFDDYGASSDGRPRRAAAGDCP